MASSSSLSYPKKRNSCALGLFILFIFCLFFFSRRIIELQIPIYRDLTPQQTPLTIPSPVRSTEKFDDSANPVLSASDPVDDVDGDNGTSSEFQEESNNEGATAETSSESDENAEKHTAPVVLSSNPEPEENSGEATDEPLYLDDKNGVPISSKSDLDNEAALSDTEKSQGFVDNVMAEKWRNCDFYQGSWVRDEGYPLYRAGSCPYIDDGFECTNNGRPDSEYLKWRWKPDGCDLPRFNATDFLVRLKGKKLLLVGDSMNRNQFESLLCLLREGLPDKSRMYEVHGYKITKGRGYFVFKFEDYNCTVEFVRSHFLVREGVRINAQGNSNPTLSIDRIDKTARRWQRADILVFNTGHWWTHGKTSRGSTLSIPEQSIFFKIHHHLPFPATSPASRSPPVTSRRRVPGPRDHTPVPQPAASSSRHPAAQPRVAHLQATARTPPPSVCSNQLAPAPIRPYASVQPGSSSYHAVQRAPASVYIETTTKFLELPAENEDSTTIVVRILSVADTSDGWDERNLREDEHPHLAPHFSVGIRGEVRAFVFSDYAHPIL
ncbi:Protein trichome birefringence-like 5 [Striga hermonthica]|uniref:Protein trichome birefringence-like 5 n=1 Tax=Striga hermonthica TaxID=68872 RepID=A0A9N7MPX2_STRHE|nr:Protein trichome birefringence-like 5 [Striga hermonthica]